MTNSTITPTAFHSSLRENGIVAYEDGEYRVHYLDEDRYNRGLRGYAFDWAADSYDEEEAEQLADDPFYQSDVEKDFRLMLMDCGEMLDAEQYAARLAGFVSTGDAR